MKKYIIYLLLIIMPFIDLITSITTRFSILDFSLGTIYKSAVLLLILFYIFVITKNRQKKMSIIYFCLLFLYFISYVILHRKTFFGYNFLNEITYMIKYSYFPILIVGLINAKEDEIIEYRSLIKVLILVLVEYLVILFIPNILNIGFKTYEIEYLNGKIGWFYSANEISGIIIMLLPLIYYIIKEKKYIKYYLILILSAYTINSIGTKTATLGFLISIVLVLILYFVNCIKKNKKELVNIIISIAIIFPFIYYSPAISNYKKNINELTNPTIGNNTNNLEEKINNDIKIEINNKFILALFSGRTEFFENTLNIYIKRPFIEKILGIGFTNNKEVNNPKIAKLIEIDFLDYFFHYGVIGFILLFMPLISILYLFFKNYYQQFWSKIIILISIMLALGISLIAGHILNSPSAATILACLCSLLILEKNSIKTFEKTFKNIYKQSKYNLENLLSKNLKENKKTFIITANPETFIISKDDPEIEAVLLDKNNIIVPDGIAVVKALKIMKEKVTERIAGIDICEFLLKEANDQKKSVYLYGAKQQVLNDLKHQIKKKYTNIKIVGSKNGYLKNKSYVFEDIKQKKPDIILVALGIPLQEKLINQNIKDFSKGIFIGVGGSFDVLSGTKKRAPKIFIKLNLEWLYRIIKEPKRIGRFIKYNIIFLVTILLNK